MPGLLVIVGALVAAAGFVAIAFGVPVKEFSFGNTLILGGTTALVGGILIVAIGMAVRQLKVIAELLGHAALPAEPHHVEPFDAPVTAHAVPPPPAPFPKRPQPEPERSEIAEPEAEPPPAFAASELPPAPPPMLRNPDTPASLVEEFEIPEKEDVSLTPPPGLAPEPARAAEPEPPASAEDPWRASFPPRTTRQAHSSYFDSMWPEDNRQTKRSRPAESDAAPELPPELAAPEPPKEPVGILKSGVVDGMAYTLYVDGSIEAELPTGTLHFASINELREHLTRGS